MRMARRELGIDERAAKRDRAADQPGKQKLCRAGGVARDDRWRLEDADADHHADGEEDAVGRGEKLARGAHRSRAACHGSVFVVLPSESVTSPLIASPSSRPAKR